MKKLILLTLITLYSSFCFSQDPTVYISNGGSGYSIIEGNDFTFSINLYSVATTDVVVDVSTIDNTTDSADYTPLSTTVTIPAGQLSSNQLTISTTNDSTIELNEYFTIEAIVTSNNTQNTEVNRSIFLWDNDTTPTVTIFSSTSLIEGQNHTYYASLSNYFSSDVSIDFATTAGTADTSDYIETSTSLTILAGQISGQFPISTIQDNLTEADETYTITATVTSGNTTNNSIVITVTIIDNDTTPTLRAFFPHSVSEAYDRNVYPRLDRPFNSDVTIQLTTSNGTAGNDDYTSVNQTKTIAAGQLSVDFLIPITDDDLDEPVESMNFTATVTSGNTTNSAETGTIEIIDNDGLPDFRLRAVYNPNVGETSDSLVAEEGYPLKFYPRLTHPSAVDTDIQITTTNGTADNSDYTTSTITTTIPAGQYYNYNEELTYPTILDQLEEDDENIFITAQVTTANTYNTSDTIEGIILDNYAINAQPDEIISVLEVGTTFQVLDNDTFEGLPVDANNLNISLIGTNTIGATLSPTGILTVPANAPQGYYYVNYQICESANPSSCDTAWLTINVESPLDASFTITYIDFNGDGFTSVGDTIEHEYTITNNGNATITDIDAELYFQGLDIVGGPLASLGAGQTDSTTFTALHIITQDDINFGYYGIDQEGGYFYGTYYGNEVQASLYDPNQNFEFQQSDGLKLNAFVDTNSNGTQENGEINFPLGQFNYEINNDGVEHNLYVSPHYLYESNPSTTYNLTYTVDPDYAGNNSTSVSYSNITVPVGSGITTYDFPITVTPYQDLAIDISSCWNAAVPGFNYSNYITYTNNSNLTIPSGTIYFTMDSALNLLEVYPENVSTTATGFTYNFTNLEPYQTQYLWVRMGVPTLPTVSLGQLITNSVDIELLSGDILPLNNTSSLTQTIVGSYDPNDVTERHGPEIVHSEFTTDDYLTYTIRFENTGTANAINIRVEDILDEQLDETTLKMVNASHQYTLERVGKDLEWNFFGIDLPPSEDDDSPVGHGYITFKIKPFPDYAIGDIIPNTAEIYFDFNPAIVTNTWTTEFVEDNLSVSDFVFESLKVYPIPTNNILYIENATSINLIKITSILGQEIMIQEINDTSADIDLTEITSGIYFLTLSSNGSDKTVKIIKE